MASDPAQSNPSLDFDAIATDALGLNDRAVSRPFGPPGRTLHVSIAAGGLLFVLVAARLIVLDQPIVENYVGRQIPTAMVARNLERGSGFLKPQLDTAPFPNFFLVEPPVFQELLLALKRVTLWDIDMAGRATSALASGLAGLGLFLVVSRMRDTATALWSLAVFGLLPITLRYGRAVQPDMLALACVVTGICCWHRWSVGGSLGWVLLGWLLLSLGLAVKVLWLFALLPLALLAFRGLRARSWRPSQSVACVLMFLTIPAFAAGWYAHALSLLGEGASASRENLSQWRSAVGSLVWLKGETWMWVYRFGLIRAFSPIAVLVLVHCLAGRVLDRFWTLWVIGACGTLLVVAGKLHHEYYWLLMAPPIAVAFGTQLSRLSEMAAVEGRKPLEARVLFSVQALVSLLLTWSTWSTPSEWTRLRALAKVVKEQVPAKELLIAREAVLYYSDRRGLRLESDPAAIRRAMAEWGVIRDDKFPSVADLVSVYDEKACPNARFLAETGVEATEFFDTPVARFADVPGIRVIVAEPGLLLIERPPTPVPAGKAPRSSPTEPEPTKTED